MKRNEQSDAPNVTELVRAVLQPLVQRPMHPYEVQRTMHQDEVRGTMHQDVVQRTLHPDEVQRMTERSLWL